MSGKIGKIRNTYDIVFYLKLEVCELGSHPITYGNREIGIVLPTGMSGFDA